MKSTLIALAALAPSALACLLPEERNPGLHKVVRRQGNSGTPIGTGDRFEGGTVAPRGLGSQSTSFQTLLSAEEIISGLNGLSATYGVELFETPYTTYEGASIYGAAVGGTGGTCKEAYRVFFNGNIHARERGSADNILYFIGDLLYANENNEGLTYGDNTYTAEQVKTALSAGIVFIPLSNPDGVAYDQRTGSCWRKNRQPASSGSSVGVDLNRNFDFLWEMDNWASSVQGGVASESPSSEVYHGSAPASEPETKSVQWVFEEYSKVRWYIDLHSYLGDVLYSWGADDNQDEFPTMNFMNSSFNSVRGLTSDTPGQGRGYGEYSTAENTEINIAAAEALAAGCTAGGGRTYGAIQAVELYPTSGASDDYAYSRHFSDPNANLVHGFTIEFGFGNNQVSCPFYPTVSQYNENMLATNAGFMEFLLNAVEAGLGDDQTC